MAKKKHVQESMDEELSRIVADYEMKDALASVSARGPGAPSAREKRRRKARGVDVSIDPKEQLPQIPGPDTEVPVLSKNPRNNNDVYGRASRRRELIFRLRAERGRIDRRKLIGPDGKESGATTSNLG
uniref:Uncharacterized protein n=1 Tax=viral metagenome TaxID=1070528 RepID=A0A6M3IMZ1_9ZZZZ